MVKIFAFSIGMLGIIANAHASRPAADLIYDIRYVPDSSASSLVISYKGPATMHLIQRPNSKQAVLEITGLSFPGGLTRKIDTSSMPGPVAEITPYNAGGEITSSKVVVQLREPANISEEKGFGEYRLVFTKLEPAGTPEKKVAKIHPWARRPGVKQATTDKLTVRAAAGDRSLEVAEDLIQTLETPVESRVYKGTKVSIETDEVNVHDIFRLVGAASGLNIISTSDVTGSVSISLKDVPWDQLLDIVLQEKQLKATNTGNVIRITSIANYNKEQDARLQLQVTEKRIEPVMMAIIPINYAKAEEIKAAISRLLVGSIDDNAGGLSGNTNVSAAAAAANGSKGGASGNTLGAPATVAGSPAANAAKSGSANQSSAETFTAITSQDAVQAFARGKIEIDPRTNSLLVTHTAEQIKRIRALIKELDVPTPQVLIESKVISANDSFSRTLSVDWGGFFQNSPPGGTDTNAGGAGFAVNNFNSAGSFAVSNTATTSGSGLFGMRLGQGIASHLDLAVSLAEINTQAKVMASPRVMVNNNKTATITDGTKLAVVTTTSTGTGSNNTTEFVTAALNLSVTPQVTNSGQVLMQLTVSQDQPVSAGTSRDISTKNISTNVLVQSGSTLVLGGVYSYTADKSQSGIPFLMDLPILGQLFRHDNADEARSELLIFVTPRVIEASAMEEKDNLDDGVTL